MGSSFFDHPEIVKLLIGAGAKKDIQNKVTMWWMVNYVVYCTNL